MTTDLVSTLQRVYISVCMRLYESGADSIEFTWKIFTCVHSCRAIAMPSCKAPNLANNLKGTPRLEEDGSLGFEIATSDPEYDKIFARFDYAIGDSSRLACQLGWPHVLISFDSALQWNGPEDFLASLSFTSPWAPLRNINALAKLDTSQVGSVSRF